MPAKSARLFIAIALPDTVRATLRDFQQAHAALPIRWLQPDGWHVTVIFIGNTPHRKIAELTTRMARIASRHAPFQLHFDRFRWMPMSRPRMLWAQLRHNPHFSLLATHLHKAISPWHPLPPLHQPVIPHITLARTRRPLPPPLPDLTAATLPLPFSVQSLHLFESHLHPEGARYTRLAAFPLASDLPD